jgi:hypothetical protein
MAASVRFYTTTRHTELPSDGPVVVPNPRERAAAAERAMQADRA